MDSVHDGATLQILYEGRTADTALNEKHAFDSAFEDLFRERSEAELLAIKKKYGATGDILEAKTGSTRSRATSCGTTWTTSCPTASRRRWCATRSWRASATRRRALRRRWPSGLAQERAKAEPDAALIDRLAFLKTAVVISSDGTNEAAFITQARKQAAQMKAVDNFCRSFDQTDPDKANTGIAFLIVCDMLLTGFDAPIEQVMYIDKKLREHTLLQAIARTNRVKKGKKRGFIVDYIGLANHLTEALSLYAAADELQELQDGMKSIASELPVLEERYQRLLQHFDALGVKHFKAFVTGNLPNLDADAAVVNEAVKALKDEKQRADFEVYLKKFLMSLDIVLPRPDAQPYRVPARRMGYVLRGGEATLQGREPEPRQRGREGEGADQRAPDQPGHQPQGAAGGAAGRGLHGPAGGPHRR
jgi:type I restriction enzyme R subunit